MKFIHLSDLHIGRKVNGFSMLEDQAHILGEILCAVDTEHPDAVLIAGDVYDKSIPSAEAVQLFDTFLTELKTRCQHVFVISGNHDSAERIAFGGRLMEQSGAHMVPVYNGQTASVTLHDAHGPVHVYMLPYLRPSMVRQALPEASIESHTDAYREAIAAMSINPDDRNILVAHAFVTGAERSESEDISVGGADNVDASVFDAFDYVALGHLHRPQNIGSERIRYCGTPLKYDFSEMSHEKSVTVVELAEKGTLSVKTVALKPLRDMRELRGTYMELAARSTYEGTNTTDYLRVTLTDEDDVPDALNKLRSIYPNIMRLDYDNKRTRATSQLAISDDVPKLHPATLFAGFYEQQNGQPMNDMQESLLSGLIERIWEVEA